jgi:hypothetical protein
VIVGSVGIVMDTMRLNMNNVIKVNFNRRSKNCPAYFYMKWIPAHYERCPDPVAWTYHVKFRVYETSRSFAVQFSTGLGSKGAKSPRCFSNNKPVYRKDIEKLWRYVFEMLSYYKADPKMVEAAIRKVAV